MAEVQSYRKRGEMGPDHVEVSGLVFFFFLKYEERTSCSKTTKNEF